MTNRIKLKLIKDQAGVIGSKIRSLRFQQGLHQKDLIDGAYSKSYLSLVESGKVLPSVGFLTHLADKLGVSVEQLIGHSPTTYTNPKELGDSKIFARWDLVLDDVAIRHSQKDYLEGQKLLQSIKVKQLTSQQLVRYHYLLGENQLELQMLNDARVELKKAIDFAVSFRDNETLARATYLLGISYVKIGNLVQASETFSQALNYYTSLAVELPLFKLKLLTSLGDVYKELGNAEQAEACYRDAVEGVQAEHGYTGLASQSWQTSLDYQNVAQFIPARYYSEKSKALYEVGQNQTMLVALKVRQGTLLQETGHYNEALGILKDALALALEISDTYNATKAAISLSCLYASLNDIPQALELARKSIAYSQKLSDLALLGNAYHNLAQLYLQNSNLEEALANYKEAIATLEQTSYTTTLSEAYFGYGKVLSTLGQNAEAIVAMQKANKLRLESRVFVK